MTTELTTQLNAAMKDGRISLRGLAAAMDYEYRYLKRKMKEILGSSFTETPKEPLIIEIPHTITSGKGRQEIVPNYDYELLPEFALRLILKLNFKNKKTGKIADLAADYLFNKIQEMQEMLTAPRPHPDRMLRSDMSIMARLKNVDIDRTGAGFLKSEFGINKNDREKYRQTYKAMYRGFFGIDNQRLNNMLGLKPNEISRDYFGPEILNSVNEIWKQAMTLKYVSDESPAFKDIKTHKDFLGLVKEVAEIERRSFIETYGLPPETEAFFVHESFVDAKKRVKREMDMLIKTPDLLMKDKLTQRIQETGLMLMNLAKKSRPVAVHSDPKLALIMRPRG